MLKSINKQAAIGIFDSGLGGLTVAKEIMATLPLENIVYFGDTARVPYGTKSKEAVVRFSKQNVEVLLKRNVKMIVVACNTSSSWAFTSLRKHFDLPILGVIDPGARKAAEITRSGRVGVIATPSTIKSQKYTQSLKRNNKSLKVFDQACPLFVPLAEEGWVEHKVTTQVVKEYLQPLKDKKVDTVILGCTHYPLLKKEIAKFFGSKVILVDSAQEMAVDVKNLLNQKNLLRTTKRQAKHTFLVSDEPEHFARQAKHFLGKRMGEVRRVKF